jgi:S1-C subfamily serine protease
MLRWWRQRARRDGVARRRPPANENRPATYRELPQCVARAAAAVVTVHSRTREITAALAPKVVEQGLGSGVVVDRDGYIVTNYHVIEEAPSSRSRGETAR